MKKITFWTILRVILAVFALYAVLNWASLQTTIVNRESELALLQKEINSQTLENQAIQESLAEELTKDEIASIARNKLGYSLPGERVFIDITGK